MIAIGFIVWVASTKQTLAYYPEAEVASSKARWWAARVGSKTQWVRLDDGKPCGDAFPPTGADKIGRRETKRPAARWS